MANDEHGHGELSAELRTLVEEGAAPPPDTALDEVLRQGRRKRRNHRLGSLAGVAVVVAGIGAATAVVPALLPDSENGATQLQTASGNNTTLSRSNQTPRSTAPTGAPKTDGCGALLLPDSLRTPYQVPEGLKLCVNAKIEETDLLRIVRQALSGTSVSVRPLKLSLPEDGSSVRRWHVKITGADFTGTVSVDQWWYVGSLEQVGDADSGQGPLIVRPEHADPLAETEKAQSIPAAVIYFPDGRVYGLQVHDPMPAELVDRIVQELATSRG